MKRTMLMMVSVIKVKTGYEKMLYLFSDEVLHLYL